ncbi:MAG: autotransporter-associated beta strand repeat-containing protein, partial [Verrucomicrobiota bacterium]
MNAATNLTANVSAGGARLDSQTNSMTLAAPLLHDPALGATADGGVTKVAGVGTLNLTGTNTYTGPTVVSNGVLNVTTASQGIGSYAVSDNATLGVSIASPGQSLSVSSLTLGSAAGPSTNNFALGTVSPTAAVITNVGALTLNGSVTVNVSGTNLNPGTVVLIAYGSGGAGTFVTGTLPIQPGYNFQLTNNTAAKQLQLVVATTIPPLRWAVGDGTWDTTTQNWQLLFGGTPAYYAETDPVTFDDTNSGGSTINVTLDVNHTPGNVTVNNFTKNYTIGGGSIDGTAGLTKNGNGTLTLSGANNYTGGSIISGGTLILNSSMGPALSSATTVNTNGTLQLSSGGDQIAAGVTVTMAGGTFDMNSQTEGFTALNGYGTVEDTGSGGALTASATCTVSGGTLALQSGGLTFNNPPGSPGLTINSGATFSQSGGTVNCPSYVFGNGQIAISGGTFGCGLELIPGYSSAGALTVYGSGIVDTYVLRVGSGGNSTVYLLTGGTILADQIYPNGAGTSLFYLNGGTLGISTRNPNRTPGNWFQALTHAYVSTNGAIIDTKNNSGHVYAVSQSFEHDPALGATADGGLTKQGAGTLTLTNGNTFTGPTFVNAGTLSFSANATITNSSLISITNGATLDLSD